MASIRQFPPAHSVGGLRAALLAAAAGGLLLAAFKLCSRTRAPAVAEARLAALNARIRPHFLFNTLNTVLSLIRDEPQRAEAALEALAELFRAALGDPQRPVSLATEIALGRQYLELEKLRLGERLRVEWEVDDALLDAPIPPLMLQPLLENAVYHGIEPNPDGGMIRIAVARRGSEWFVEVANAMPAAASRSAGNQMALANIRERLALYYDPEARLEVRQEMSQTDRDPCPQSGPEIDQKIAQARGLYRVRIVLPCPLHLRR